jgi:ketosteroid isomerase-like protein
MNNEQTEIQKIISGRISAVKNKDVEKATAFYSPDVISYDVVDPLEYIGIDSLKERLKDWLSSLAEIIDFEITHIVIRSSIDLAYCSSLNHINAVNSGGNKLDMWWRETTCYAKINGTWKITHAHNSVPFNTANGKASLDLKPQDSII